MSHQSPFECFGCNNPIPEDEVRERIKDPPGACRLCGHAVILEVRQGAIGLLAAEMGEKLGHIEVRR